MICSICHQDTWNATTRRCTTPTCPMGKHVAVTGRGGRADVYGQLVGLEGAQYVVRVGGTDAKIRVPIWRIAWHPTVDSVAKSHG